MANFLKLTQVNEPILVNVDHIATIEIRTILSTGKVIGTRITFNATVGGGSPEEIGFAARYIDVKESFDDIAAHLGQNVNIIHVTPVNREPEVKQ